MTVIENKVFDIKTLNSLFVWLLKNVEVFDVYGHQNYQTAVKTFTFTKSMVTQIGNLYDANRRNGAKKYDEFDFQDSSKITIKHLGNKYSNKYEVRFIASWYNEIKTYEELSKKYSDCEFDAIYQMKL